MADPAHPVVAHVETIHPPAQYSHAQILEAFDVCYALGRGRLVYCLPPDGR